MKHLLKRNIKEVYRTCDKNKRAKIQKVFVDAKLNQQTS